MRLTVRLAVAVWVPCDFTIDDARIHSHRDMFWYLKVLKLVKSKTGLAKKKKQAGWNRKAKWWKDGRVPCTLSTPALRMEFPFLFHLSANMGPLCCPKVLARFPDGWEKSVCYSRRVREKRKKSFWRAYHPWSISWQSHRRSPSPGGSRRSGRGRQVVGYFFSLILHFLYSKQNDQATLYVLLMCKKVFSKH